MIITLAASLMLGTPLPIEIDGRYRWEPDYNRMKLIGPDGKWVGFLYQDRRYYQWVEPPPNIAYRLFDTRRTTPPISLPKRYKVRSVGVGEFKELEWEKENPNGYWRERDSKPFVPWWEKWP